jgi:hypothetical protein
MAPDRLDEIGGPRRERERQRVTTAVRGQLVQRGIEVRDADRPEQLMAILDAVELFEARVAALGGDSFTNAPDSSRPDDRRLVIPRRSDDESGDQYARRVADAAAGLGGAG